MAPIANSARTPFKLALLQMQVEPGDKPRNLQHALELIRQAARQGAEVIVLPEAMTLGWTHPSAKGGGDAIPDGEACLVLRDAARQLQVHICAGLVERAGEKIFNAAVLIDDQGRVILHHRKLNELEIGHEFYDLGDRLAVVPTRWGVFGLMICADAFARGQVISRTLGYMGAEIILSPSSWAVPGNHDHEKEPYGKLWMDHYGPVARDFGLWIAGVSNVGWLKDGPWQGRKCIGCSLVVDPSGQAVLKGPYGDSAETILFAEVCLPPRPAQGCGWEGYWQTHLLSHET